MGTGYVKAVQTIADDQTEVATKTQELLDTEEIDSGELTSLEVTTFGANKFLITILYNALRELRSFTKGFGLKTFTPTKRLSFIRTFSVTTGLKSSFHELTKDTGNYISGLVGILLSMTFKLGKKMSTKVGLKASSPVYILASNNVTTTKVGMKVLWAAWLNGVQIELYP
jgi:hypothetical protein